MRFRLDQVATYIKTGKAPPALVRLVRSNKEVISFLAELENRPPRMLAVVKDYEAGMKVRDIAEKYGCARGTIHRYVKLAGIKTHGPGGSYGPEKRKAVLRLYRAGVPLTDIAEQEGVSQPYISTAARKAGLYRYAAYKNGGAK